MEKASIRRSTAVLIDDYYNTPKTSLMTFHFEPDLFATSDKRLKECPVFHGAIEGKDFYIWDQFFQEGEKSELRDLFGNATYSRFSYGSPESIEQGEKPAKSMNNKERWDFFSKSPPVLEELHKLFSIFAHEMDADLMTLPWELCHGTTGSPSVIANYHEKITQESLRFGKHQDCCPAEGVLFGIPKLYAENELQEKQFENGAKGKPWMISMMLYSTSANFCPKYKMGTVFFDSQEKVMLQLGCKHSRLILFEGDIHHSTDASEIPVEINVWRTSYVFKLIMNPKRREQNLKQDFYKWIKGIAPKVDELVLPLSM